MNKRETKEQVDCLLYDLYCNKIKRDKLQKQYDTYRKQVIYIMKTVDTDILVSKKYNLVSSLTSVNRETLPKRNLPKNMWDQYKNISTSEVLNIKKVQS